MRPLIVLLVGILIASLADRAVAQISEAQAMRMVRELPEFKTYAKTREYAFDDNQLISDRTHWPLPPEVSLPAWRIDVHTVIDDVVTKHLSLWHRFIISASGQIWVWRMPPADDFVRLDEWRKHRKT